MNPFGGTGTLLIMKPDKRVTSAQLVGHRTQGLQPQIIDVRTHGEFDAGHLPGAINIPMETLESRLPDLDLAAPTVLVCHSGTRAGIACAQIGHRFQDVAVLEGGTAGWIGSGEEVVKTTKSGKPIMQQSLIGAGLVNAIGLTLGLTVHPAWLGLSMFASAGLIVAGSTGFCLMAIILAKMPWNRAPKCSDMASNHI